MDEGVAEASTEVATVSRVVVGLAVLVELMVLLEYLMLEVAVLSGSKQ